MSSTFTPPAPDTRPVLQNPGLTLGADPELFLVNKNGRIVGAETLLNKYKGKLHTYYQGQLTGASLDSSYGFVEPDGVQAELHPKTSSCRQSFSAYLQACLLGLNRAATEAGLKVSFDSVVHVRRRELEPLSEHARLLGCGPSLNFYGREPVELNGMVYRKRSGAGHMHLGSSFVKNGHIRGGVIEPSRLVPLLDLMVGVIGVLIDKDPLQRERRKNYGRAGEYRLPKHGLEYRTPGNFWLKNYFLYHFMFGQARLAHTIAYMDSQYQGKSTSKQDYNGNRYAHDVANELFAKLGGATPQAFAKVERAINRNDQDAAYRIYDEVIKPVLKTVKNHDGLYTVCGGDPNPEQLWEDFEFYISRPLEEWVGATPEAILNHWVSKPSNGWESYVRSVIRPRRLSTKAWREKSPITGISGADVTASVNK